MLSNVPLCWMLKEIMAADTGIMFRKSELHRYHISYDKLVKEAAVSRAERVKRDKERVSMMGDDNMTGNESSTDLGSKSPQDFVVVDQPPVTGGTTIPEIEVRSPEGSAPTSDKPVPKEPTNKSPKNERQTYKDGVSPITDELKRNPFWWCLEILPFIDSHQDEHGHWRNYLR